MSESSRETQKKQNRISQKSRIDKGAYNSLPGHINDNEVQHFLVGETPFQPPMMTHLEMISGTTSVEEKTKVLAYLQQSYGNMYVQSLVESINTQTNVNQIKAEIQREYEEEEEVQSPPTEQEEELPESSSVSILEQIPTHSLTNNTKQKQTDTNKVDTGHKPPQPMVPLPSGGACVIVRGGAFDIWIHPDEPACVLDGMRLHENKHIADFTADPYYSTIPSSGTIPDGETFRYRSWADAKRFEHPAIDLEMEWIRGQISGILEASDRTILENRLNVTLPAYRASFG